MKNYKKNEDVVDNIKEKRDIGRKGKTTEKRERKEQEKASQKKKTRNTNSKTKIKPLIFTNITNRTHTTQS